MSRPLGFTPSPLLVAEALADGDEHLEDLATAGEGRFAPMRFLWCITPTGSLVLRTGL